MNEAPSPAGSPPPLSQRQRVDQRCDEFERLFQERLAARADLPRIEEVLEAAAPADREHLLRELLRVELELRRAAGLPSGAADDYRQRFAEYRPVIESIVDTASLGGSGDPYSTIVGKGVAGPPPTIPPDATEGLGDPLPPGDGRYQIRKKLGRGGFAVVYLAHDTELDRPVALKVPRQDKLNQIPDRQQREALLQLFADEARKAAKLDDPGIVRVFDVLRSDASVCIVLQYVEGVDLETYAKNSRLTPRQCAELLLATAAAVGHAHRQGFVHRDLKPQNILIDSRGQPHVADFGLSLHESAQREHAGELAGTFPYMSPEQVRREVHRLDGRSDLWSLGVILYELLTGRRPFTATRDELFDEILHRDPKPPRMIDPQVPAELSRICLACLAKRATDRYQSAADLIDDLRHWLDGKPEKVASGPTTGTNQPASAPAAAPTVVPKGLRSYDANDASFFLQLLPGPHDRDGLPKSVRFWKTRLEQRDPDETFTVGMMYGPSGCGKSSLVKAALLPHLSGDVVPIYVEATAADTEVRLLKSLKKHCPELPTEASLPELFARLRDHGGSRGRKVVLVLDQFEQWLHAHAGRDDSQLIPALRQCDGASVQALVLVRDDFWMSATRFMQALEVPLVEGHNSGAVDLFDLEHAGKVLAMLGRGYGKLPAPPAEPSADQQDFLAHAVRDIAEEGKVISVRLAVFAEMMKGRSWTTASLREVGGTTGVGASFLEETFSAKTAAPAHRLHQQAARAVLKSLLPEQGTEIKGQMRSYDQLLDAAGYRDRRPDFDVLLRILDGELRLITPTEPDGGEKSEMEGAKARTASSTPQASLPSSRFYQLTHDYLVPSLRDWLTRKQRETRRGRAELRLEERAATWNAKPENRHLPSLWEYLQIATLARWRDWKEPQRQMMRSAGRYHATRTALLAVSLVVLSYVGFTAITRQRVRGLVDQLVSAEPAQLPTIVAELEAHPSLAATYLSPLLSQQAETPDDKRARLHARLATVAHDPSLVEPLVEELLTCKATYVIPIRQLLRAYSSQLSDQLRSLLRDEKAEPKRRFHAALALADYIPESESASWTDQDLKFVAGQLVSENAEFQPLLREALRPIRGKLLTDLERIFGDVKATDAQRLSAANAFAAYAASDVATLSRLLVAATPEQFSVLFPLVEASRSPIVIEDLGKVAATLPSDDLGSVARVPFGQRRANAAVTLLRLGEKEKVLPVFDWTDDPEALTQFIFRCKPRGISVDTLLDLLEITTRSTPHQPQGASPRLSNYIRYALLLAIGEYAPSQVPSARREALVKQVADWYANDPSSGVHGASGWLLRHLGEKEIADRVDQTSVPYSPEREWFTLAITVTPTPPPKPKEKPVAESGGRESATTKAGDTGASKGEESSQPEKPPAEPLPAKTFYYTFIVFPDGEYTIGSVVDEPDRDKDEVRHPVKLTRPFALLDREITWEELITFKPFYSRFMQQADAQLGGAGAAADWYDAVGFCRWLGQQSRLSESGQAYAAPNSLDKEQYPREPTPGPTSALRDFHLATEAEWEVGSRAGARTTYGFGSEASLLERFGWFMDNSGRRAHPPRELRPSLRGLYDLHGNLIEWTHDWYGNYGIEAFTDPLGAKKGEYRVLRGGSWKDDAAYCRPANRFPYDPTGRAHIIGFRLALSFPSGVSSPAEQGDRAEPAGGGTEERSGATTTVP